MGRAIIIEVGSELTKLVKVGSAVGKMHVTQHKYLVCVLSRHLRQHKILTFSHTGIRLQTQEELRKYSLGRHFISAWNGNEDISPFLVRLQLVDAVLVSHSYLYTI